MLFTHNELIGITTYPLTSSVISTFSLIFCRFLRRRPKFSVQFARLVLPAIFLSKALVFHLYHQVCLRSVRSVFFFIFIQYHTPSSEFISQITNGKTLAGGSAKTRAFLCKLSATDTIRFAFYLAVVREGGAVVQCAYVPS